MPSAAIAIRYGASALSIRSWVTPQRRLFMTCQSAMTSGCAAWSSDLPNAANWLSNSCRPRGVFEALRSQACDGRMMRSSLTVGTEFAITRPAGSKSKNPQMGSGRPLITSAASLFGSSMSPRYMASTSNPRRSMETSVCACPRTGKNAGRWSIVRAPSSDSRALGGQSALPVIPEAGADDADFVSSCLRSRRVQVARPGVLPHAQRVSRLRDCPHA